jgi:Transposase and inactivated derivatives
MDLLFELYPKLKEAYDIINKLRAIFRSKNLTKDTAKVKFKEWYTCVNECTLREIKSARDAIKDRENNVLNYFINRSTNAAAESLNSKLKSLRAQVRGITDLSFFMYRVCKIFG